jgi:cytochrome c553
MRPVHAFYIPEHHAMNRWVKRTAYTAGIVVGLVLVIVGVIYALSEMRFRRVYDVPQEQLAAVTPDTGLVARGEHLATAVMGCADCHSPGLTGRPLIDEPPMGRLVSPNLTKGEGGVGASLTPESIERAVRHGIGRDGRALRIMPSHEFQYASDEDMRALIAYVQSVPPGSNTQAPSKLMFLPRALLVAGQMPLLPAELIKAAPGSPMNVPAGATKEYGAYLSMIGGCTGCHGPGLSGGKIAAGDPKWGPAANITRGGNLGKWTEAEFIQTMRTGKRPDGVELKPPMPWQNIAKMTDDELRAIWLYLQSVPPKEFGNR